MKKLTIKGKPISSNFRRVGRTYTSAVYTSFKNKAIADLLIQKPVKDTSHDISVKVTFYMKSILKGDIDNLAKCVLDSCTQAGVWEDDRFINKLILEKIKSKDEYIEIELL